MEVPQAHEPLVHVILLNYRGWQHTIACVTSLRGLTYTNVAIVVVDNASPDGSEAHIRDACPDVTVIQSGANLGFAGGNNVGIRHALEQGAEYVWLLNNDTLVDPDALGALVRHAQADPRAGLSARRFSTRAARGRSGASAARCNCAMGPRGRS
jgi:GT2 family glycosyltransferase